MRIDRLRRLRLRHHALAAPARTVVRAAERLCATQAQELWGGKLALATRTSGTPGVSRVDAALERGELVRSWAMRGTLHLCAARDLGWMLAATRERMLQISRTRMIGLGLDDEAMVPIERILVSALRGGNRLSRAEAFAVLGDAGVETGGQRGSYIVFALAARGIVCWGPAVRREDGHTPREQRLVLVDEWIREPAAAADPMAELFVRYILGHGPATAVDFSWWSGMPLGVSRRAADAADERVRIVGDPGGVPVFASSAPPRWAPSTPGIVALASFEEYYISYADRSPAATEGVRAAVGPGQNGMVRPILLRDGEVVGTWRPPTVSAGSGAAATWQGLDARLTDDEAAAAVTRATAALRS